MKIEDLISHPIGPDFQIRAEKEGEGNTLVLVSFTEKELVGRWVDYEMMIEEKLCAVAVTGITRLDGEVLVGKRAHVRQFPDCWELVPSGGIERSSSQGEKVDFYAQILKELEEEAGITRASVAAMHPLFLIQDQTFPLIDICIDLKVTTKQCIPNEEYSEMLWCPYSKLGQIRGRWVPLSKQLTSVFT